MDKTKILDKFIQLLSDSEDTLRAAGQAFSLIGPSLNISQIILDLNIPETRQTPTGEVRHLTVYLGEMASDEVTEIVWLEESTRTFENGVITAEQALGQLVYKKVNHQICIRSQEVIDRCLVFDGSEVVRE